MAAKKTHRELFQQLVDGEKVPMAPLGGGVSHYYLNSEGFLALSDGDGSGEEYELTSRDLGRLFAGI